MRFFFCWPGINGYMAACWRALIAEGHEVMVAASSHLTDSSFSLNVMRGVPHFLINADDPSTTDRCAAQITVFNPDIIYLPSWGYPVFNALAFRAQLRDRRFIMGMDNPWRGTLRQRLGRFRVFRYLARMEKVLVPGERSYQFAIRLGVPQERIARCAMYGVDAVALGAAHDQRRQGAWPRRFLFVGRYVHEKGIDLLMNAHRMYARSVGDDDAWPLDCCGQGRLAMLVTGTKVFNHGFVQPQDLAMLWRNAGVLVHPARLDHWPIVVVEAASAGLPSIVSEDCGSVVEVVRPFHNGLVVPSEDASALARAMTWMHERTDEELAGLGMHGRDLARAFGAQQWAHRLLNTLGNC